ncbi:IS3 family transposase [Actinosynnema sp. NPDC047251]|uniref:IS3 family transposase n=1 Tax=Saccharothrix espanaensis TaxID=103731 RepID=UPI0002E4DD7B|nr:IS3 family transposase [Saccharothrix espanaensis]
MARQADPSDREREDRAITAEITDIHTASGGTYGSPRVHQVLRRRGVRVSRKRVERLMRQAGLQGAFLRKQGGGCRRPGGIRGPHRRPIG